MTESAATVYTLAQEVVYALSERKSIFSRRSTATARRNAAYKGMNLPGRTVSSWPVVSGIRSRSDVYTETEFSLDYTAAWCSRRPQLRERKSTGTIVENGVEAYPQDRKYNAAKYRENAIVYRSSC